MSEEGIDLRVKYHPESDYYYVASEETNEHGVPLIEIRVDRANIEGEDRRKEVAMLVWQRIKDDAGLFDAAKLEAADRCDAVRGYHSNPHRGCLLR